MEGLVAQGEFHPEPGVAQRVGQAEHLGTVLGGDVGDEDVGRRHRGRRQAALLQQLGQDHVAHAEA